MIEEETGDHIGLQRPAEDGNPSALDQMAQIPLQGKLPQADGFPNPIGFRFDEIAWHPGGKVPALFRQRWLLALHPFAQPGEMLEHLPELGNLLLVRSRRLGGSDLLEEGLAEPSRLGGFVVGRLQELPGVYTEEAGQVAEQQAVNAPASGLDVRDGRPTQLQELGDLLLGIAGGRAGLLEPPAQLQLRILSFRHQRTLLGFSSLVVLTYPTSCTVTVSIVYYSCRGIKIWRKLAPLQF